VYACAFADYASTAAFVAVVVLLDVPVLFFVALAGVAVGEEGVGESGGYGESIAWPARLSYVETVIRRCRGLGSFWSSRKNIQDYACYDCPWIEVVLQQSWAG